MLRFGKTAHLLLIFKFTVSERLIISLSGSEV